MAILEHASSKQRVPLAARTLVGRSSACHLRLTSSQVSGIHAELTWNGECWTIRDLDSRNGTRLGRELLKPTQRLRLERGAEIVFGTDEHGFTLVDASPPELVVIDEDGAFKSAHRGLLYLPPDEAPGEMMLFERLGQGWWLESEQETRRLEDGELLALGQRRWRVFLPGLIENTDEARAVMTVSSIALDFRVSRDEEHVAIELRQGARAIPLRPRAHDYLLLCLARARLEDQRSPSLEQAEHGWIYVDDLASQLKIDRGRIKLWVHRARREFADAGVYDIARLVERRRDSDQVRLGVSRLQVARPG